MTTTDRELTEQIRDEWDDAVTDWLNSMDGMVSWDQVDELLDPLAAAVLPTVKAAQAEALREAAEDLFWDGDRDTPMVGHAELYDRADQIEKEPTR